MTEDSWLIFPEKITWIDPSSSEPVHDRDVRDLWTYRLGEEMHYRAGSGVGRYPSNQNEPSIFDYAARFENEI